MPSDDSPGSSPPTFSLVIPSYNEAENVVEIAGAVSRALAAVPHEILFVDDDSPDGTWNLVESYGEKDPRVRGIRRVGRRGLSGAVVEGFQAARGDILGVMDADLSHDPAILPEMIQRIEGGADVVVGSRRIPGGGADKWPLHRRVTSGAATSLAKMVLPLPLSDPMSGYFVLRREMFERVKDRLRPKGYKILLEILWRARPCRIEEVPFVFRDRKQGYSKLTPRVMLHLLQSLIELRFSSSRIR